MFLLRRMIYRRDLFDMPAFKSPGPDSLQAKFYQKIWVMVGDSLYELAKFFFETKILPDGLNDTFMVLSIKVQVLNLVT